MPVLNVRIEVADADKSKAISEVTAALADFNLVSLSFEDTAVKKPAYRIGAASDLAESTRNAVG